ncbi:MAG TPA: FecR domain-containing protein [Gemmatimonadales bacterium]|jgi:ferric-dicitrate binding protein FerR (iron transport regulator)
MAEGIEQSDLLRFVEGDCSPDEAAAIQAWIAADPQRGELLDEIRALWRLTGSTTRPWVVAEARIRLLRGRGRHAAQGSAGFSARPRPLRRAAPRFGMVRIAAAIACVVAGTLVWRLRPRVAPFREYATQPGQRLQLELPDSSRVLLSVGTRLRVPRDFGISARAVELDGEAYFVVRHDPRRPFLVRTRRGVTEDLGTSFDVRAYPEDDYLQVVVAAGRVALRGGDSVLSLRSRDRGVLDARGVLQATSGVSLGDYLGWTRGTLVFHDAPLDEVVTQLERWYDVDIAVTGVAGSDERLTIAFATRSVDEALAMLAQVVDARWTRSGRTARLTPSRRRP